MESIVTIRRCDSYDSPRFNELIAQIFEDLGGIGSFVKRGDRVLLKPNLLRWAAPEKAMITHPAVVEAVSSLVIDAGAKPFIGDSPPLHKLNRVLSKSGYDAFMSRLGVDAVPFMRPRTIELPDNGTFRRIDLADEVFEFDSVINIAKLKTHAQMGLTLAVKNLFGAVIGADKAMWHMRAGNDYDAFATVLVQIYQAIGPAVSIVDGILCMEGDGPTAGTPRHVGIMAGAVDAVALDAELSRLVGFQISNLRTSIIGDALGVGTADREKTRVTGDPLDKFPLTDFESPESMTVLWNMSDSSRVRKFLKRHAIPRPEIDHSACEGCQICLKHCPPQAITERDGRMIIDRKKCISCFCCQELCVGHAIDIEKPLLGRILSRISKG